MNQQKLIEDNMNLVYFTLHKYYPLLATDEDLIQCGMIGLCRAANTWDESKSTFSTYATKCILNEFNNELRSRKKHIGVLSLDYTVTHEDGEETPIGELIESASDFDFGSVEIQMFYDTLSDSDKEILDLRQSGLNSAEIARMLGVSRQRCNQKLRRIRLLWEQYCKNYGEWRTWKLK